MVRLNIRYWFLAILILYILFHIIYTFFQKIHVDNSRISYERLSDGPLLLKPGRQVQTRRGNVIEAIGYGLLTDFNPKQSHRKPQEVFPASSSKKSELPEILESNEKHFLEAAKTILQNFNETDRQLLYFTLINKAFERMTLNWICNTALFPDVHSRTLIVSMDQFACESIKSQWDDSIACISLNIRDYDGGYEWGKQKYINLLTIRAKLMFILTKAEIPYVLFETDATWFKDPLPLFLNRTSSFEDFDIIVPIKGYNGGTSDTLSHNPMLAIPTNGTLQFLEALVDKLENNTRLYDQDVMNEMCAEQFNGLICRTFEYDEIADGKWFKSRNSGPQHPYIVNNNFYVGIKNKETRQSLNGLWFLATRSNQCKIGKVRNFLIANSGTF
ncbi:unnamed protein product [Caenorhabditis bovis]|uniref:Nucleotide-diphospho-sugar transferase domain-containing protein n=1 Tax=Caenorhabditis bovis TaxID=2654633 RepID=A0A8S1FBE1_9PELO|nr:unnamed protein product [Caenorhabditis bovis]